MATWNLERSVTIAAPPERIWPEIVDFHRWQRWSPWEDLDPELNRSYTGPDEGVGAHYAWTGNRKAGAGSMEITSAAAPSALGVRVRFDRPFKSESDVSFAITPEAGGSRVVWSMVGEKNLAMRVMGVFTSMDKLIGPDLEKGLARLRSTAEAG